MTKKSLRFRLFGIPKTLDEFVESVRNKGFSSAEISFKTTGSYQITDDVYTYKGIVYSGNKKFTFCKEHVSLLIVGGSLSSEKLMRGFYEERQNAKEVLSRKANEVAHYLESRNIKTTIQGEP